MNNLRVSIALATYQGEAYLSEQLQSFLSQTRLPDELCVSDDGSSDGTVRIIEDFRRRAPFPVKLSSVSGWVGSDKNFEKALLGCSGEFILFSDQDDVWLPDHIESLIGPMEQDARIMAVASNSTYVSRDLIPTGEDSKSQERFSNAQRDAINRLPHNQFEQVLRHRVALGHGMAFRAEILPLLVPFPQRTWNYDHWVFILAAAAGFVTYAIEPLTLHREHPRQEVGNVSHTLGDWARMSATSTEEQDQKERDRWKELLVRVREHRDLLKNPEHVEYALEQKLNFVVRRTRIRKLKLPARIVQTTMELLRGHYHRWGRGMLTYGRDLYGKCA